MSSKNLFDIVQLVTGIAVVIGLVLVIWELKQAREMARAQLISDSYQIRYARHAAVMGENASEAISKACREEELSSAEARVVMAYYQAQLDEVFRRKLIGDESGLYEDEDWKAIARLELRGILSSKFGRLFWEHTTYVDYLPELASIADKVMKDLEFGEACMRWYEVKNDA